MVHEHFELIATHPFGDGFRKRAALTEKTLLAGALSGGLGGEQRRVSLSRTVISRTDFGLGGSTMRPGRCDEPWSQARISSGFPTVALRPTR
jgi:hypothetical protein